MGTWGAGLYENDSAADARDMWIEAIRQGAPDQDAADQAFESLSAWADPIAWIALADTMWTWGRLDARVLEEARRALAAGGDLELWTEAADRKKRQRVLDKVAQRLAEPPPAPKTFKADSDALDWKAGQLWAYRTLDRKWVVFRVTAVDPSYGIVPSPLLELLDVVHEGDEPPAGDLSKVGLRTARPGHLDDPKYGALAPEHRVSPMFEAAVKKRGERPRSRLRRLRAAGTPRPAEPTTKTIGVPWSAMDDFLAKTFDVGGPRPGAVIRWPLPAGGAGYAMIEFGSWDRTPKPQWQVSLLGCRGDDVAASVLETAPVTARLIVYGFPPAEGLREVAHRPIESADQISGAVFDWEDVPRKLAAPAKPAGSNDAMKAFMALAAAKAAKATAKAKKK